MLRKKVVYAFFAFIAIYLIQGAFSPNGEFKFLENSMLSILQNIAEDNRPKPPDLSIEKVTLRKIGDPVEDFNFYKYYATIEVKNHGGDLKEAQVTVRFDADQKKTVVKNNEKGFSILSGQKYILDRYEVLFDGNYNGGEIIIELDITDKEDYYKENNSKKVTIFELPPKLADISISQINEENEFEIDFNPINASLNADEIKIMASDSVVSDEEAKIAGEDEKYGEIISEDKIYGYHRIKISPGFLEKNNFSELKPESSYKYSVKFSDDPWEDKTSRYIYIKATNPENGYFAVSNILKLSYQKEIDRADFAKLFVDYAGVKLLDKGKYFYEDVDSNLWYGPYVQTIYNLGLIKNSSTRYYPEAKMSRADALKVVMDFCDIDLVIKPGAPHFGDVPEENYIYPYVEGLYASGNRAAFAEEFNSGQTATKNFLKHIINECKENP